MSARRRSVRPPSASFRRSQRDFGPDHPYLDQYASDNARPGSSRTPLSVSPSSSTESVLARTQQRDVRPRPLKVVIIGPEAVGKTSLRQTYFTKRFQHNYKATIGADFEAKVVQYRSGSQDRKVLLSIWDTCGQERFKALGSAFYRGADAIVLCFDSTNSNEAEVTQSIHSWFHDFKNKSSLSKRQEEGFCWVAVGCKSDLRQDGAVRRQKVREILNDLVPRLDESSRGMPTSSEDSVSDQQGKGDNPPAPPQDVLSREGIHEEDDRDLILSATPTSPHANGVNGKADPISPSANEGYDLRSKDETAAEEGQTEGNEPSTGIVTPKANGPVPSAAGKSPANLVPSSSVKATNPRHNADLLAFPSRSSPTSTDISATPTTTHLGPQTPPNKSAFRAAGVSKSSKEDKRNRFDSNISMASSSQLSVYHTPRNSHFFGGASPATIGRSRNLSLTPSNGTNSTIGGHKHGADSIVDLQSTQNVQVDSVASGGETVTTNETPVPAHVPQKDRRRALSEASIQTLASGNTTTRPSGNAAEEGCPAPSPPARGFSLFYTSALTGTNVDLVFQHIVSRCRKQWDYEEYHSYQHFQKRKQMIENERQRKASNRKSIWNTLKFKQAPKTFFEIDDYNNDNDIHGYEEFRRIQDEMRRMVRVSDGKADDAQKGLGGCC
ncbi:unnamed protein product [Sympodiomycopsis kandeliae]